MTRLVHNTPAWCGATTPSWLASSNDQDHPDHALECTCFETLGRHMNGCIKAHETCHGVIHEAWPLVRPECRGSLDPQLDAYYSYPLMCSHRHVGWHSFTSNEMPE